MAGTKYKEATESKKNIIINNFLGGISWALGVTIGAAIIISVLGFILGKLGAVPFIGHFATQVSEYIDTHKTTKPK